MGVHEFWIDLVNGERERDRHSRIGIRGGFLGMIWNSA